MKIKKIILVILVLVILSVAVVSQLAPASDVKSKIKAISSSINLEKREICKTKYYDEVEPVYGECKEHYTVFNCLNSSGPGTDCSEEKKEYVYKCVTAKKKVTKEKTECKPDEKFIININKGSAVLKKQLDFSDFGPCIYEKKNECLVVTCVSKYDGAYKGQFTNCDGGKSCQKFEICDGSVKKFYKNSRENFAEEDPSFYLPKINLVEVAE